MTNENKFRDLVKKMAVDLRQARSRVEELEERAHEPVAVVGIGCRFPGTDTPEGLWDLLVEGRETRGGFPTDRGWDLEGLFNPDPDGLGRTYVRSASFLEGAGDFDPAFFGINPREATAMDPQHRLVMETAWEALEHAGITPGSLHSTPAGVFVGMVGQTYGPPVQESPAELVGYRLTGGMTAVAAGRVSYTLGLEGPAITVDTACSSSLVSIATAVRSLRSGESSLALAGGVTAHTDTSAWVSFSGHGVLSADGRCKAFSADADGTGWGEAAGMLVLERLSDARRNGRRVLAVIRGGAVNQDGASSGLTAPSGPSQERVIRQALADARLTPADVDAVEAHGTGTRLGDPIEANALLATYGRDRTGEPLWLGSLKTNIGHTGAAAGVSGVIKSILALRAGILPRTLHVAERTPFVDWSSGTVELLTEARPWPETGRPRRVGVSAFGASGTNAHLILEQAPEEDRPVPERDGAVLTGPSRGTGAGPVPWVLSAHSQEALGDALTRLRERVASDPGLDPVDVGWSLATTRTAFEHRAVVVGADHATLLSRLDEVSRGVNAPGTARGRAAEHRPVLVFPGQGGQWEGMALGLLESSPVFAEWIGACERSLAPFVDWSLSAVLRGEKGAPSLERVDVVQPVLWAVMVALAELWRSYGLRPSAVVGHSQGEVAAACVSGALSLEDGAKVVALRSRAVLELSGTGMMASVALPEERVRADLAERGADVHVHVAVVNSPSSTVIAGNPEAVARLVEEYEESGVRARKIAVDYASHTPHVERLRESLASSLSGVVSRRPDIPFYSALTGRPVSEGELDAAYWYRNLAEPVLFRRVTENLMADGHDLFVEAGPHPVLSTALQETAEAAGRTDAVAMGTLRRDEGGHDRFLTSLAQAYAHGAEVDWTAVFGQGARVVDLPTYPFQRQRLWMTGDRSHGDVASAGLEPEQHPLLGAALFLADTGSTLFTGRVSRSTHPWLLDHAAGDSVLLPGTAFLELALNAGDRLGSPHVDEIVVQAPLVLPENGAVQVQVSVEAADDQGRRAFSVYSRPASHAPDLGERPWTRNVAGALTPEPDRVPDDLGAWPPPGAEPVSVEDLYTRLDDIGYAYGPAFRGLTSAWLAGDEVYAEVELPEAQRADAERFGLHPALSDAAQHAIGCAPWMPRDGVRLPFSWNGVTLHATGATSLRVHVRPVGADEVAMTLADADGAPVATVDSLTLRAPAGGPGAATASEDDLFHVEWVGTTALPSAEPQVWAVLGEDILDSAAALTASGHTVRSYTDADALTGALDAGAPVPDRVLLPWLSTPLAPSPDHVHAALTRAVDQAQRLLADERVADSRQVLLTHRAVATGPDEDVPDLVHAPLWGFVRAAGQEHPGRFSIVDTDDPGRTSPLLIAALSGDDDQLALRGGTALTPRLARSPRDTRPVSFGDGTVLVTGATGTLGGEVTHHLVDRHGVRDLLLVSRSGPDAKGAAELEASLAAKGADVTVAACDVSDRDQLASLLNGRRVTAVVHAAVALDDGLLASATPEGIDAVLRPKVDAAWHLHELTEDLSAFVVFSSVAGTLGSPGQSSYSAANSYTDMLAHHRRAHGLPAVSLSWGMWAQRSRTTAELDEGDISRYARLGLAGPVDTDHGLALFDTALATGAPHLLPVPMDLPGARARAARTGRVATMLRGLVRPPRRRAGAAATPTGNLRGALARTPVEQRADLVLSFVLARTAEVLGHTGTGAVDADTPFLEVGFDSLTAVELRNHLAAATGLRLPAGLAFAHPTPRLLAAHLVEETAAGTEAAPKRTEPRRAALDGLVDLFVEACSQRRIAEGIDLLWAASQVRPVFTGAHDAPAARGPVRLSREGSGTKLICLPSILMISGVQEYARFANGVRGLREVEVIPEPGFSEGESLPASIGAVAEVLADAVLACAGDQPYILVGRSSGGWVAHAVLERLEQLRTLGRAHTPQTLALMDAPHPTDHTALATIETGVVARGELLGIMDGVRLSAMGAYLRLFRDWLPGPVETPVVQLRPEQPTIDRDGDAVPPFTWSLPHEVLRVPGDHFTMLEGHVDVVGRALHDWLADRGL
ncbi:type I polyketide synthase [Nocardiopsis sp. CT-R113]|uniref:Type I polyketide synthase n=1 Tax=Nocardiopsis codii TaxID=3065942 RepID=A0ABU7K0S2_9ACTN|nr:type I polyketide synthase [Nocardiopsis sp. CT-R113]MEE2035869.1 type I polyketide synthase [Nocardiopsis sp. CT-R113]